MSCLLYHFEEDFNEKVDRVGFGSCLLGRYFRFGDGARRGGFGSPEDAQDPQVEDPQAQEEGCRIDQHHERPGR
jgi:hypothetical protein